MNCSNRNRISNGDSVLNVVSNDVSCEVSTGSLSLRSLGSSGLSVSLQTVAATSGHDSCVDDSSSKAAILDESC